MSKKTSYTDEERKLIAEGFACLMKGSVGNVNPKQRKELFKRADEIKGKLGIKKYKDVIDINGKLLV